MLNKILKHIAWRVNITVKIYIPQLMYSLLLKPVVYSGIFSGMKYFRWSYGSVLLPKLLGTYENEISKVISETHFSRYDAIIDIGAAEGYYAVGLAKYFTKQHIIAYETNSTARKRIYKLAVKNDVSNQIVIKGYCDVSELKNEIEGKKVFILMDVEGYELSLLNISAIPQLKFADILVELHPDVNPSIEKNIYFSFNKTHDIEKYTPQPKKLPANINFNKVISNNADFVVNEFRGNQLWFFLKSKQAAML